MILWKVVFFCLSDNPPSISCLFLLVLRSRFLTKANTARESLASVDRPKPCCSSRNLKPRVCGDHLVQPRVCFRYACGSICITWNSWSAIVSPKKKRPSCSGERFRFAPWGRENVRLRSMFYFSSVLSGVSLLIDLRLLLLLRLIVLSFRFFLFLVNYYYDHRYRYPYFHYDHRFKMT